MKTAGKKKQNNQSLFAELFWGIINLFLGDGSSKITLAIVFLIIGILFLTRPVVEPNGTEINKDAVHYVMSSVFLLLSVGLTVSWIRKRNTK